MFLQFEKWHGCSNDFLVIKTDPANEEMIRNALVRQAKRICDRHTGVGADGILLLAFSHENLTDFQLTIINSDGSIAANCGNGLRCAAGYVNKNAQEFQQFINFNVNDRIFTSSIIKNTPEAPIVQINMGQAVMGPEVSWHEKSSAAEALKNTLGPFYVFEIGNPHIVFETSPDERIKIFGPQLQSSILEDGINVHFAESCEITKEDQKLAQKNLGSEISELYKMIIWERGAGLTLACGSGACAVASKSIFDGLYQPGDWIAVDMPGGRVYVMHEDANELFLAGAANFVYKGEVEV